MTRRNLEVAANFSKVLPSCIASLAVMLFCCPSTTTLGQTSSSGTNKAARQTTTKPAPGIKAPQPAPTPAAPKPTLTAAPANVPKSIVSNEPKSDAYRLQHKLKVGEVVRTRTVHFANTVTRVQGTEDISESKTTSDKAWQVSSVSPSGEMTFEYRIDAVDMYQKVGENDPVTYNSRTDKEAPEMFAGVAGTIEKPIATVTIDPTGTVIERDKQTKAPPLGMGELAVPLPKEPVALGAQWNIPRECRVKLENGTQKAIKIREQYTLEKVSAGVATIRVESQPITPIDDASIEAQLMQQLSKGEIKFDIDRGRLISKRLDWDDEVVGFRGAETALKYVARFTEELIESK